MFSEYGNVGRVRYHINQLDGEKLYHVFVAGIARTSKKTLRGAYGVLRKIDPNFASDSTLRMREQQRIAGEALRTNVCPSCGGGVHRNLALTGWVQCDGFGADGFRKNPNATPCSWQGFTGE